MKLRVVVFSLILISQFSAQGQSFRDLLKPQMRSPKLQGPQHLHDYVRDGKLQLSLHDAVLLTLENNSAIQVELTAEDFDEAAAGRLVTRSISLPDGPVLAVLRMGNIDLER